MSKESGGGLASSLSSISEYYQEKENKRQEIKEYFRKDQMVCFSRNSSYVYELFTKIEEYIWKLSNPGSEWTKEDIDELIKDYNDSVKELNRFVGLFQDGTK